MSLVAPEVMTCTPHHSTEMAIMKLCPKGEEIESVSAVLSWFWLGAYVNERGRVVLEWLPCLKVGWESFLPNQKAELFERVGLAILEMELPQQWVIVDGRLRRR